MTSIDKKDTEDEFEKFKHKLTNIILYIRGLERVIENNKNKDDINKYELLIKSHEDKLNQLLEAEIKAYINNKINALYSHISELELENAALQEKLSLNN